MASVSTLRLMSAEAPDAEALRSGMGTIRLRLGAGWTGTAGAHHLLYRNLHREESASTWQTC